MSLRFLMRSLRRLPSAGGACALVLTLCAIGCGDNPAGPDPNASGSAKPGAAAVKKPDPLVTKTFKAESCAYGALSLKLAQVAYTESLGGGEPGPDKIPDFGAEPMETPPVKEPMPAGSSSAGPAGSAKAAPTGSAKAAPAPTAKATTAPTAK